MKSSSNSAIYIPEKGDVVWIDFNPQSGREQAGRRPALVICQMPDDVLVQVVAAIERLLKEV